MNKIVLIGGGGHCSSIIDSVNKMNFEIVGILDKKTKVGSFLNGIEIIGEDELLSSLYNTGVKYAFISTGSIGNKLTRQNLYETVKKIGFKLPNIIDKSSIISSNVEMGEGNFIGKGVIVNTNTIIRNMCILNTGVIIDHDCRIGNFVHLAPGTTLSGNVEIMNNTHIGTNSTIIQGLCIGSNSLIGAGSVITKNIPCDVKAYGCPAKVKGVL